MRDAKNASNFLQCRSFEDKGSSECIRQQKVEATIKMRDVRRNHLRMRDYHPQTEKHQDSRLYTLGGNLPKKYVVAPELVKPVAINAVAEPMLHAP